MTSPAIRPFADLATAIRRRAPRCGDVRVVAVDGGGGAGKSVFAERLARSLGTVPIVHTDDFASWVTPLEWWDRLEDEVLGPLCRGDPVRYRAHDWTTGRLGDWRELPRTDVLVLEGVSSGRRAVTDRLSILVWIETPATDRLARGLARDGQAMRGEWERWMAEEDAHYASDRTRDRADVIVDGILSTPHDPDAGFICLGMSSGARRVWPRSDRI